MSDLSMLMDMGFDKSQAERALQVTGNKGVEPAMEWLLAHADVNEPIPQETFSDGEKSEGLQTQMEITESENDDHNEAVKVLDEELAAQAKSLKCDELETIIKQRRAEREEQEKKEALEKEISRRKTGQEITQVRQKMQEEEMKQLAEAKRREKLEAKQARQRVLEQIERDKQARREKFNMPNPNPPATSPSEPPKAIVTPATPIENYDQTRIQVRLMNGECLTHSFSPNEELAAVRLFVQMNRSGDPTPFSLMTNFPKKVFTEEDMNTPLSKLGLVPSAVLIVCKPQ
ncbi:unnamed protein product [Larinioides sclopetarius]|uniref:UBX domain-containing protein 1 n=1 Tax=Larinioides sclopetarius TaxID=280406 RepID=A0AAV2AKM9_9ARAC